MTCPSWVLTQGSLEPATEEDVFVVRLAAGERLTVETYGMAPGVCAGVDTVVDVRAWPLNALRTTSEAMTVAPSPVARRAANADFPVPDLSLIHI